MNKNKKNEKTTSTSKNKWLTIIIPIWNTDRYYIERLINSIEENTFKKGIEIIIVNDASTNESTLKTLNKYRKKYTIVNHTENKGLGPSRNTGFLNSSGKYIWFIDSDDYISETSILKIFNLIKKNKKIDFISINYYNDYGNEMILNSLTDYNFLFHNIIVYGYATVWSKIFSKNFLLKNNIFHHNSNLYHEDEYFSLKVMMKSQNIRSIKDPIYFYNRRNLNSITNSIKKIESFKNLMKLVDFFINEIDLLSSMNNSFFCKYIEKFKNEEIYFLLNNSLDFRTFYWARCILFPIKKYFYNYVIKNIVFCFLVYCFYKIKKILIKVIN